MTHAELTTLTLSIHGAILLVAATAYYKYGDRTEIFDKSLAATNLLLAELRRRIGRKLAELLTPVFESPGTVPSVLVDRTGERYREHPVNPVGSEAYLNAVRDFVEDHVDVVVDYHAVRTARGIWSTWAQRLSWAILSVLVWEVASAGVLVADKIGFVGVADWIILYSFVPTGALVVGCLTSLIILQRQHDKITAKRVEYDGI